MKTYRWDSTNQTATPIESNTIPVYDTKQDVEDDLNNLEVGQLVSTTETSDDIVPVDVVENGNMNPVTSNAVYDALQYKVDKSSIVDTISDGNMNPVTSNAVYDTISALISKGNAPTPTLTPTGINTDIVTTTGDVTIAGINIGRLGGNAIHLSWTTGGYLAICVDTTVIAAIRVGRVIN